MPLTAQSHTDWALGLVLGLGAEPMTRQSYAGAGLVSFPESCRNYIAFEDLRLFLPAAEALSALRMLDVDGDGKIFPDEMRDAVLDIYRERKHLASTLSVSLDLIVAWESGYVCRTCLDFARCLALAMLH